MGGANWDTVQEYLKLRKSGLKKGKVEPELVKMLSDDCVYHIKGVFSTTDYKTNKDIVKYLNQPAESAELSAKEKGKKALQPTMSADGKKFTTFEKAKKFGSWWTVKAVFTFDDDGKIKDVWAGKA